MGHLEIRCEPCSYRYPSSQVYYEECHPSRHGGRYVQQRSLDYSLYSFLIADTFLMYAVIGIYGLIVGVILAQSIQTPQNTRENVYSIYSATAHVRKRVCMYFYSSFFAVVLIAIETFLLTLIFSWFVQLAAGLCCGLSGLVAGGCIGIVGDTGVRAVGYRASSITLFPSSSEKEGYSQIPDGEVDGGHDEVSGSADQNKLFVGMLIMLIFSEALAL